MSNMQPPKAIDLFCGAGGISAGLRLAGYEVIAGVDLERTYFATFRHNFPQAHSLQESVLGMSPAEFSRKIGVEPGEVDILVGGPPCQGFSKNVPRRHRYLEDPKNLLVKAFLDYCEFLRPRLVLMENVAEMKNGFEGQYTDEILDRLDAAGYAVTHAVLNAADYGVPQRRRRAFFLGDREGVRLKIPRRTHVPRSEQLSLIGEPAHVSVWEAIGDLPSLQHGEAHERVAYAAPAFSEYQRRVRTSSGKVANHVARHLQATQLARLAALSPGQGHKDLPPHLQVKSGYSGAYGRLTKDMIAPTITRWVFHPGSGRYGHPVDTRVLSIREVARIQGFPDSYEFVGTYTQQAGQLGNAVPPLLAFTIVNDLQNQLRSYRDSKRSVSLSKEIFSATEGSLNVT